MNTTMVLLVIAIILAAASALFSALAFFRGRTKQADMFSMEFATARQDAERHASGLRMEVVKSITELGLGLDTRMNTLRATLDERMVSLTETFKSDAETLRKGNAEAIEKMRETLTANLEALRKENDAKLEQMRVTVDEKLQGTLETRLGESFKLVSGQLELVHKGLGEMQSLATGVGDLKRALTNIKSRGGWGEVQLGALLEDMLAPDQFDRNAQIAPGKTVEFAVKMPGRNEDGRVYLPIDSKFPHEDYDRLLTAQEAGAPDLIEGAAKALEKAIRIQAKTINEKYIQPPKTTDFAIMYLPTEGLYAEVARRPGLMSSIQNTSRVVIAGPSNLAVFLNSLQMGFRTLAIEKRSSEVWQVLGAAKAEFQKYGEVWDRLGKQLDSARRTVDEAGKRTRAVERKLRGVEVLETSTAGSLIDTFDDEGDETDTSAAAALTPPDASLT